MSDAFDVSLRVKLTYNGAKAAIGHLKAIHDGAQRLGSQQSTRDLDGLVRRATIAKAGIDDLARAGARLAGSVIGAGRLATDIVAVVRPAADARRSRMESNREVRRSQARALHSVGRIA